MKPMWGGEEAQAMRAGSSSHAHQPTPPRCRYADLPVDWRSRMAGAAGTLSVLLLVLACLFVAWSAVAPTFIPPSAPLAVIALPPAAPPEPVEEVPEGPKQVESKKQERREQEPEPPELPILQPRPVMAPPLPPAEPAEAADPAPDTTAPKSLPMPPAQRASSNAEATWEALLLRHLERHRRYPGAARAARQQGVAHVRFRMNRAGAVLSVTVLRTSGVPDLDRAALDTVRRAQPLPAIPPEKPDEVELVVPVEFFLRR